MNGILPKGWVQTNLGTVSTHPQYGWTCSSTKIGSLKLLRTTDISSGKVDWDNVPYCSEVPDQIEKFVLGKNDIVVSRAGSIGVSFCLSESDLEYKAVFASYLIRFRPLIPATFVYYYLKSSAYWQFISASQLGIAVPNVNASKLAELPLPLPPLTEQKRIIAKLDAIMPRIHSVKERLEKIPAILKSFRQSVLTAAVTGKLTEKWREEHPDVESAEALLDEKLRMRKQYFASYWKDFEIPQRWICALLKNIADLRLGKMLDGSKNKGISMRYLRNINVRWFGFDLESLKEIRITQAEKEALSIKTGDVFVCEGGEPGRSAVWKAKENNMTFQKALHRVRMKISFLPDLLVYNLKVDADTKKLDELFTGSTIKHFTGRSLAVYPVAIPPLEEQKEIVRQVDKLFALADKVEEHYQNARARVDALAQSVLAKAFRGELVSQDPNDEPAEKLLQRIQEEKAKMEAELKNASRSARGSRRNGAKTQRAGAEEKQASEP